MSSASEFTKDLELRGAYIVDRFTYEVLYFSQARQMLVLGKINYTSQTIDFSYQLSSLDSLGQFFLARFLGSETYYIPGGASTIEYNAD